MAFAIDPGRGVDGLRAHRRGDHAGARRARTAPRQVDTGAASRVSTRPPSTVASRRRWRLRRVGVRLVGLDEDALAGALLGGLDDGVEHVVGEAGETLGAARVGEDLVAFLDVGEAVVEQGEDGGGDLLAEAVAGAEILVDPDLHLAVLTFAVSRSKKGVGFR